jgi:hypothetical protein
MRRAVVFLGVTLLTAAPAVGAAQTMVPNVDPRLRLGEVEVVLSVETRGAEHSDRLINTLRKAGYAVITDHD